MASISPRRLPRPSSALVSLLLAAALFVALFLRTHELSRFPPGPYYDEAAALILAGEVTTGRYFPIFIRSYTGHEVLFYYLAAGVMRLVGVTVWALRLTSALVGAATVVLTFLLVRELFDDDSAIESHWLGLFAAALAATSFWHVVVSRYGLRAITLPLVQSLMLWALWRGLKQESLGWIAAAGVFTGLAAYTYLASRVVPLALAILLLAILAAERQKRRLRLMQLGILAVTALIVFAPLGLFFAANPETFFVRVNQLSIAEGGGAWQAIAVRNILRALQVFVLRGDPDARLNLSEQPMFRGVPALAFCGGLLFIAVRLVRVDGFLGRVRCALFIFWPLVMLLPTVFADPTTVPHSLRAIGVMPLVFVIPALGFVAALGLVQRSGRMMTALTVGVFSLVLGVSTVNVFQDYLRWATLPRLYYDNDQDIADMARYLDSLGDDARALYVGSPDLRHPTVAALTRNYDRLKWMHGGGLFVFPPGPALYVWPNASLPDDFWLARFFPPETRIAQGMGPDGAVSYIAHARDRPPVISPTHPLSATFGGVIEAIGYDVLRERPSGGRTDVAMYWRVLRKPERGDYNEFFRLYDAWGMEWARGGSFAYPSEQWEPGEIIAERIRVQTIDGTPPGQYTLKLGWWSPATGEQLPILDSQGRFAGMVMTISPVTVTRRIRPLYLNDIPISHRLDVDLGGLALLGFDQWPSVVRQGESEFVALYWQARTAPLPDRQVVLRAHGEQVIELWRGGLVHGAYPSSQWGEGEFINDRLALRIPPDTPPGTYTLQVQVDDFPEQPLGWFDVQAIARRWTPPAVSQPLSVMLGTQIELVGYTLETTTLRAGRPLTLTLVWKALACVDADYIVFVHLVDADGVVRSQQDNAPVNNTYPTTLWQPGEFISDVFTLALPPDLSAGDYTLEAGMYLVETGARLPVLGSDRVILGKVHVER